MHDQFEAAAIRNQHCRIVYKDTYGEHHAVMVVPVDWRILDTEEWGFFRSEGGDILEVKLSDMVAIEPQSD
ncbi:MAG: hypothetical protein ACE5DZ_03895 [Mariprofundus sp.]